MIANNYAPAGWAFCEGQSLPIAEYDVLFTVIGTTYGGDGESTFHLPDLRSRVPVHQVAPNDPVYQPGAMGGVEEVTLTINQIPNHGHAAIGAAVTGDQTSANNALPANSVTITPYLNTAPDANFNAAAIAPAGGSQPHTNLQPYLCIHFIIALYGRFPSQT